MQRFPFIITLGAALLGYIAGELLVTDPLVEAWIELHTPFASIIVPICGALVVAAAGKWLSRGPTAGKV